MNMSKLTLLIALMALSTFCHDTKDQATLFTAKEMHKLARLSQTVPTPDGRFIVYVIRNWDSETGKVSTHLEYQELSSGKIGKLTDPALGTQDFNPVFSKGFGNTLLFLSARTDKVQIFTVDVPDQVTETIPVATQLTKYPIDVISFKWSWDSGNTLVFNSEVYSACGDDLNCTAVKDDDIAKRGPNTWAVYDKLMMRHWDKWLSDKVSHLFVQKLSGHLSIVNGKTRVQPILQGNPLELMLNMEVNAPVGPFGGSEMYDIHPDGSEVAFTGAERTVDEAWNTGWKIYIATVSDKSIAATWLTTHIKARTTQPKYSNDGSLLGYLAMDREGLESDKTHLDIYDRTSKIFRNITGNYDRALIDYTWISNTFLYFTATDYGNNKLFEVDLTSGKNGEPSIIKLGIPDFYSNSAPINIPGTQSYIVERSSFKQDNNAWILDLATKKITQVTNVNPSLANFEMTDAESFSFKSRINDEVQGFIFKPVNFKANVKYPLAFLIHGGPEGAWESSWSTRWNVQLWTNAGYAVVVVNPHGSTGMGQKFTDLVRNDWGGLPYNDLMDGMDYVKANYLWVDTNRACAVGASYGGYMVNWIQGQTDRFKCLVTHDGVFSTLTMFYATEELWFPLAEYCPLDKVGCKPYDPEYRDRYLKFSPEAYVQNWKTPHLVIHGSNDLRIPVSEGISVFSALQLKGVPSRFVHFTEENHWVLKAENSIKWYEEVIGWMDRYTKTSIEEKVVEKKPKKLLK